MILRIVTINPVMSQSQWTNKISGIRFHFPNIWMILVQWLVGNPSSGDIRSLDSGCPLSWMVSPILNHGWALRMLFPRFISSRHWPEICSNPAGSGERSPAFLNWRSIMFQTVLHFGWKKKCRLHPIASKLSWPLKEASRIWLVLYVLTMGAHPVSTPVVGNPIPTTLGLGVERATMEKWSNGWLLVSILTHEASWIISIATPKYQRWRQSTIVWVSHHISREDTGHGDDSTHSAWFEVTAIYPGTQSNSCLDYGKLRKCFTNIYQPHNHHASPGKTGSKHRLPVVQQSPRAHNHPTSNATQGRQEARLCSKKGTEKILKDPKSKKK